jgi:uncharacterized protein (TIRG00374 family)
VPKKEKKPKTMKIPIVIALTISIAIIVLILFLTIDVKTFEYISTISIRYEFFAVAVLLNILYWVLWGARLRILSNAIDKNVNISLWESTKIVIANLFLAGITPSMAGGEPVRIHLLNKDGLSLGGATASVLGERLLDAIFLLLCVPFALFIFKDRINIGFINTGLTIGIVVFILAIIIFAYAIKNPERTKSFLFYLNKKLSRFSKKREKAESNIINKISSEVDNFHNSMVFFLSDGKNAFIKAGILTIIFWSTGFMMPSMILLGLGLEPFFIESYAAQVLLIIIVMMPTTPGSAGITEGGVAAFYSVIIGSSYTHILGVFIILFRFITYHMNLIAGAIFQYRIFKSVASFSLDSIKKQK